MKDVLRKPKTITRYVVGFAFDATGEHVLLILKNRPEWQKGLLNGVGGKVEKEETSVAAMVREFQEETEVETSRISWTPFMTLTGNEWTVDFFYTTLNILRCRRITDEELHMTCVENLPDQIIPNLRWLIPMALYHRGHATEFNAGCYIRR